MHNLNSTFKDIFQVMSSNIITLLSGIVNGFVLPYVLGVTNYGYYRIFILYSTYTALLHCGFVDGILLKYGGKNYKQLNKYKFRSMSMIFIIFQLVISICLSLFSLLTNNEFYFYIFILLGIYTFIFNLLTYYTFIAQATMRFDRLSIRNSIQALISIILTIFICIIYKIKIIDYVSYKYFIYVLIIDITIMLLWYIHTYKDITFGTRFTLKTGAFNLYKLCKIGIYLTISYQISNLIMVIDNQFVSSLFPTQTYGKYSFSYGMSSRALVILGAISTVLLPHLKKDKFTHIIRIYPKMITYMMLFVYFSLIIYFPLSYFVKWIFPTFIESLSYLKIFLPELGMTCCVTMIIFNYYNVFGKSKFYFCMSVFILILSIIIDECCYLIFKNAFYIAIGSFIDIFIWYVASEYFLIKWYHVHWVKNFIYMILMITSFLITSLIHNLLIGFIGYLFIYIILSIFLFKNIFKQCLCKLLYYL